MDNRICVEIINSPHTNSRRAQIDILLPTLVKQFFDESVQLLIRTKWITNLCKIQIYVRFSCCHISFKIRLLSKIFPKFFNKTFYILFLNRKQIWWDVEDKSDRENDFENIFMRKHSSGHLQYFLERRNKFI